MKQGKTLVELAQVLQAEHDRKLDFVADTRTTTIDITDQGAILDVNDVGAFEVTNHASRQICSRLKVPAKLHDLLAEGTQREQAALAEVLNARMHEHPERRMIRAFHGDGQTQPVIRAYLSDRY